MARVHLGHCLAERSHRGRMIFQPPVLVKQAPMLGYVEPDQAEQMIAADTGEEIGDLCAGSSNRRSRPM